MGGPFDLLELFLMGDKYWLTAAGCDAAGGHKVHCPFCAQCSVCFVVLGDVPT